MKPVRVLVVEDEAPIRRGVVDALRAMRYEVDEAADGEQGLRSALEGDLDLVLLDLLLPKRDGLDVLSAVRARRPALPVIVLTARGTEEDRVRGLKMGADDYIVKPFSARELLARVEAVLRRTTQRPAEVNQAQLGEVTVDLRRREVRFVDGTRQSLSETEATLLGFLLAHRDRAISREELLAQLWGIAHGQIETRTVDMHVARLRAKLRDSEAIVTVRSQGYMASGTWQVAAAEG